MSEYRTTPAQFELFKKECKRLQKRLGLLDWSLYFAQEHLEGAYAETTYNLNGHCAIIKLNRTGEGKFTNADVKSTALHEMCHLLLARVVTYACQRWADEKGFDEAHEGVVVALENILTELKL